MWSLEGWEEIGTRIKESEFGLKGEEGGIYHLHLLMVLRKIPFFLPIIEKMSMKIFMSWLYYLNFAGGRPLSTKLMAS